MTRGLTQNLWKTKVSLYLFFEGIGAGCYLIAGLADLLKGSLELFVKPGLTFGVAFVILGAIFLWLDLGRKWRFYLTAKNLKTSWIARGVILVTLFLISGTTYVLNSIWPLTWLNGVPILKGAWGSIGALFALTILIYPGMLLKSCKPFKLWNTPMIVVLFVVLSLLTSMAILLLAPLATGLRLGMTAGVSNSIRLGLSLCGGLLLAELVAFGVYLFSVYESGGSGRASLLRLTQGDLQPHFVVTAIMGWILPLILISVGLFVDGGAVIPISLITIIFLLVGSLLIRYILLRTPVRELPFCRA